MQQRILENYEPLRNAFEKVLLLLKTETVNITFINISYSNGKIVGSSYPGMAHMIDLRGKGKDNSATIFYGFEDIDSLIKKQDASILNSPAVQYVKMPMSIQALKHAINTLSKSKNNGFVLDRKTNQIYKKVSYEKISSFRHIGDNIYRTILLNVRLAQEAIQRNPDEYPKSLERIKKETLINWSKDYDEISSIIKLLRIKDRNKIIDLLGKAVHNIEIINSKSQSPLDSIKMALGVAEKIKETCDILSHVKKEARHS